MARDGSTSEVLPWADGNAVGRVKAFVRVRPLRTMEVAVPWALTQCNAHEWAFHPVSEHSAGPWRFDRVLDVPTTNEEVYEHAVAPGVAGCLDGTNFTAMCYGQSATGKSHTALGGPDDPGLVIRAATALIEGAAKRTDRMFVLRLECYEVARGEVIDLLSPTWRRLQVLHSKGGDGAAVTGATQRLLVCPKDAHWALVEAMGKRAAGGHGLNPRASRSHAVVRLVVESRPADPGETGGIVRAAHATQHLLRSRVTGLRSSRLDIVDLAGASPQSEGEHSAGRAEGSDLCALRRVVSQLAARTPKRRVDYGASPLTYLLRDALGGNSITSVVATVTDSDAHMGATAHTLEFAHLVRSVYNRPTITELPPSSELLALFSAELAQLKEQLVHGVTVEPEEQTTDQLLAKMHEGAESAEAKAAGVEAAADSVPGTRSEAAAASLLKQAAAQLTEERARARRAMHENRILNTILTGRPSGSQHTQLISRIVDDAEHLRVLRVEAKRAHDDRATEAESATPPPPPSVVPPPPAEVMAAERYVQVHMNDDECVPAERALTTSTAPADTVAGVKGTEEDTDEETEETTSIASWIERLDASSPRPHPFLKNLSVRRKDIELKELLVCQGAASSAAANGTACTPTAVVGEFQAAYEASEALAKQLNDSQVALMAAHEELATLRKAYVWQRRVAERESGKVELLEQQLSHADRLAACLSASSSSAADPKNDDSTQTSHGVESNGPTAANGVMGDLDRVLRTCPNCTQAQRANAELVLKVASLESSAWRSKAAARWDRALRASVMAAQQQKLHAVETELGRVYAMLTLNAALPTDQSIQSSLSLPGFSNALCSSSVNGSMVGSACLPGSANHNLYAKNYAIPHGVALTAAEAPDSRMSAQFAQAHTVGSDHGRSDHAFKREKAVSAVTKRTGGVPAGLPFVSTVVQEVGLSLTQARY